MIRHISTGHNNIIKGEKNIKIRERHEQQMKYNYMIFLILFLGGGIYLGQLFLDFFEGAILAVIFLFWYAFLQGVQEQYHDYTDQLIREEENKKRKTTRKQASRAKRK